jgi:serine/threonine-protein kinase
MLGSVRPPRPAGTTGASGEEPTMLGRPLPVEPGVGPGGEVAGAAPAPREAVPGGVLERGAILDQRYRIIRKIGQGGMGSVWEAEHITIRKRFAIKLLHGAPGRSESTMERLMNEARAASKIGHQNIVEVSDFGSTARGEPYFVMEYLEGRSLGEYMKARGPLPWVEALEILEQLTDALDAAHDVGVIHADLKPDNIFLVHRRDGKIQCKVLDFGIARVTQVGGDATRYTRTSSIRGTPSYMSPEQARGERVTNASDIYSLACLAYHALTGARPFPAKSLAELVYHHLFEFPRAMREVAPELDIPIAADTVIRRAMCKDPALRFASMSEMGAALAAATDETGTLEIPPEDPVRPGIEQDRQLQHLTRSEPNPGPAPPPRFTPLETRPTPPMGAERARGFGKIVGGVIGVLLLGAAGGAGVVLLTADQRSEQVAPAEDPSPSTKSIPEAGGQVLDPSPVAPTSPANEGDVEAGDETGMDGAQPEAEPAPVQKKVRKKKQRGQAKRKSAADDSPDPVEQEDRGDELGPPPPLKPAEFEKKKPGTHKPDAELPTPFGN